MPDLRDYTIVTRPDDNGACVAYVPAIAGCHALGATREEAQAALADVFEMIAEEYGQEGRPFPPDIQRLVSKAG